MNVKRRAAQFLLPGLLLVVVSGGGAVAGDFALCSDAGKEASGAEKNGFGAIKRRVRVLRSKTLRPGPKRMRF